MKSISILLLFLTIFSTEAFQIKPPLKNIESWNQLKLQYIRKQIDFVDDTIYSLIEKRIELAKDLTPLKPMITDPFREIYILNRLRKKGSLDPSLVKKIWSLLFHESYLVQKTDDDEEDLS